MPYESTRLSGAPHGLVPAGLGARNTLRLEARMLLYGNDMDGTTTLLEAGLGSIVKLGKEDFIGRDALAKQKQEGVKRRLIGFEMVGREIARDHYPVFVDGRLMTTLKGDRIVAEFIQILNQYVGTRYGSGSAKTEEGIAAQV